jgi:hypothetical protein
VNTDREIQLAREVAYKTGNKPLTDMLQQLLDYRRAAREVLGHHDYRQHYNRSMPYLDTLVGQSGCVWFQCTAEAKTRRMRAESHSRGEASHLCCAHADEGEQKGLWLNDHPTNVEWRRQDYEARKWAQKRAEECAQEGVPR